MPIRFARGIEEIPLLKPVGQFEESQILMWLRGTHEKEIECDPKLSIGYKRPRCSYQSLPAIGDDILLFDAEPGDLLRPIDCKAMAKILSEVDRGEAPWSQVCFIQFVGVNEVKAREVTTEHTTTRRPPSTTTATEEGGDGEEFSTSLWDHRHASRQAISPQPP